MVPSKEGNNFELGHLLVDGGGRLDNTTIPKGNALPCLSIFSTLE
jgi:hypothetical protein